MNPLEAGRKRWAIVIELHQERAETETIRNEVALSFFVEPFRDTSLPAVFFFFSVETQQK